MNNVESVQTQAEGTNLRSFMAYRGAIIKKECRPFGEVNGKYNDCLEVQTMILTVVKEAQRRTLYGITLSYKDKDKDQATVQLDFDEIDELTQAMDFIKAGAAEMANTVRDYTEVKYATKDNAEFGFFQNNAGQTAYVSLTSRAQIFLSVDNFAHIRQLLSRAQTHLIKCGAQLVSN